MYCSLFSHFVCVERQYLLCNLPGKEVWMCYLLKTSLHQVFWKHVSKGERGEVQWLESFGYIRNLQRNHVNAGGAFTSPWKRSISTHFYDTSKMASLTKRALCQKSTDIFNFCLGFGIQTNRTAFLHRRFAAGHLTRSKSVSTVVTFGGVPVLLMCSDV